jgi:hypothetical protein
VTASSSAWASSGFSMTTASEGFLPHSPAGTNELSAPDPCCADPGTTSQWLKAG